MFLTLTTSFTGRFGINYLIPKRLKPCLTVWNAVFRTIKEISSYDKEIKDQSTKIQKMKDESKDSHDIKQQVVNPNNAIPTNALTGKIILRTSRKKS